MRLGVSLYKMSTLTSSLTRCSSRLHRPTELPLYSPASLLWQSFRLNSQDSKSGKNTRPPNLKNRQEPSRAAGLNSNDQNDRGPQTSYRRFDKDSSQGSVGSNKLQQGQNSATSTNNYNNGSQGSAGRNKLNQVPNSASSTDNYNDRNQGSVGSNTLKQGPNSATSTNNYDNGSQGNVGRNKLNSASSTNNYNDGGPGSVGRNKLKQGPNSATSPKYNEGGRPSNNPRGIQASDYKVQEYLNHDKYTYYDVENKITKDRLQQPDAGAPLVPDTKR